MNSGILLEGLVELGRLLREGTLQGEAMLASAGKLLSEKLAPLGIRISILKSRPADGVDETVVLPLGPSHFLRAAPVVPDRDGDMVTFFQEVAEQLISALSRDSVSSRVLQELELKSQALDTLFCGFELVNEEGKLVFANAAYLKMWGYDSLDEVVGMPAAAYCAEPGMPGEIIARLKQQRSGDFEFRARRKDGSHFEVHMYCRSFRDWEGREFYTCVSLDVTDKNELRRRRLRSQKMDVVGQLTGGVAHDFNNLLHVINGGLELTLEDLSPESPFRKDIEQSLQAGRKAGDLIRQLLLISRRQPVQPQLTDLSQVLPEVVKMVKSLLGENAVIDYRVDGTLELVEVDRGMLEQALVNLFMNARDAVRGKSEEFLLEVGQINLDSDAAAVTELAQGSYCRIRVTDRGLGMSQEVLEQACEPYFTTKSEGEGSGLGLSTVYGIMKRHHGHVSIESKPGEGTSVSLLFPSVENERKPSSEEPDTSPATEQTILVVDDNNAVRKLAKRVLEKAGFQVLTAENGLEALDVYEASQEEIDMVMLDLSMPKMGGVEAFGILKRRWPDVRALFATGYTDNTLSENSDLVADVPVLHKPYSATDLVQAIREALNGRG